MPRQTLENFAMHFGASIIPWEFVDLIEVDPARRVKLKIEHERLASMHPSDLADILEDLSPPEREAIFVSLDEEVAADALEEVDPRLQKSLLESLDSGRVADIVEEMDPARPPICWPSFPTSVPRPSLRRWSRKSGRK